MKEKKLLRKPMMSFVILSNIIFWPLFLLVGLTGMLGLPELVCHLMLCVASWASTYAFIILFPRIYVGQSLKQYIKDQFKNKLKGSVVMGAIAIQVLIIIGVIELVIQNDGGGDLFTVSSMGTVVYLFVTQLIAGPLGEELGWRGFMLTELQKKYSGLVASLIVGFWWAMWHLPIWFTTGLGGVALIKYMVCFTVSVVAITIIMTVFYNLNKNLFIPIMMHQLFNFLLLMINRNTTDLVVYYAVLYLIAAVVLIMINPKKVLYGKRSVVSK